MMTPARPGMAPIALPGPVTHDVTPGSQAWKWLLLVSRTTDLMGVLTLLALIATVCPDAASAPKTPPAGKPVLADPSASDLGTHFFSQGGVVLDGIAYFTGDQSCSKHWKGPAFPFGVSFDLRDFHKIRTYPFKDTYDSSPLLIQRSDGEWLIVAHEHEENRAVAFERDTGHVAWVSGANQPGSYFFAYAPYHRQGESSIILGGFMNGLHALDADTGEELWYLEATGTGGVTPCVDQKNGWAYYQSNGQVMKVDARDGTLLQSTPVGWPGICVSWNTVLVNDEHGYFIATYWFAFTDQAGKNKQMQYTGGVRVFDGEMNLVWEKIGLPSSKKSTLSYAHGKLVVGTGGHWGGKYEGTQWKYLPAYDIATGELAWKCDLTDVDYQCIMNAPYAYGRFFAETMGGRSKLLRVNAETGELEQVLDYGTSVGSCAAPIIARGMMLSGDLTRDGIVVTRLAEACTGDWPGAFGDPQTHTYALPDQPGVRLVDMEEITFPAPGE